MAEIAVASLMTTRVIAVGPETPLRELISTLTAARVHALPVVDRYDQPIGVVSEAELRTEQVRVGHAAELMTTPVRAVHVDEPVTFVARLLAKPGIRRLYVVNWDSQLVGVMTRRDLLRAYSRDDELPALLATGLRALADTSRDPRRHGLRQLEEARLTYPPPNAPHSRAIRLCPDIPVPRTVGTGAGRDEEET